MSMALVTDKKGLTASLDVGTAQVKSNHRPEGTYARRTTGILIRALEISCCSEMEAADFLKDIYVVYELKLKHVVVAGSS
jgi:hypothetical protein